MEIPVPYAIGFLAIIPHTCSILRAESPGRARLDITRLLKVVAVRAPERQARASLIRHTGQPDHGGSSSLSTPKVPRSGQGCVSWHLAVDKRKPKYKSRKHKRNKSANPC